MKLLNSLKKQDTLQLLLFAVILGFFILTETLGPIFQNMERGFDWKNIVRVTAFASFNAGLVFALFSIFHKYSYAIMMGFTIIYGCFAYANLLHYRGLDTFLHIRMLTETQQLNGLDKSIWGCVRWYDIFYVVIAIISIFSYRKIRKNFICFKIKLHIVSLLVYLAITFVPVMFINKIMGGKINTIKSTITWSCHLQPINAYQTIGLLPIIGYQVENESKSNKLSDNERSQIDKLIHEQLLLTSEVRSIVPKKNLVVLVLESFNTNCISSVMPNLDSLCKESSTLYCPQVRQMTQGAMSIGGQFVVLSGLHGLINAPFCSLYPHNTYPSIARELSDKYEKTHSSVVVSTEKYFWRQNEVSQALGFDVVLDYNDGMSQFNKNKWADDKAVFECALSNIPNDDTPFVSVIVPSNMHALYTRDDRILCDARFDDINDEECHEYLRRARYLDTVIADFIEKLKERDLYENTMIVVTSDHQVPEQYCSTKLKEFLSPYIPVAFINTGNDWSSNNERNKNVVFSHSQVYPTMLQLLGISPKQYAGLFQSMIDVDATIEYDFENISYSAANERLKKIYDLEEKMIQSGYFGTK